MTFLQFLVLGLAAIVVAPMVVPARFLQAGFLMALALILGAVGLSILWVVGWLFLG